MSQRCGGGSADRWWRYSGQHDVTDPDRVITAYRQYLAAHDVMLQPIRGVPELLTALTGARPGMMSSEPAEYVRLGLTVLGWEGPDHRVGVPRPNPTAPTGASPAAVRGPPGQRGTSRWRNRRRRGSGRGGGLVWDDQRGLWGAGQREDLMSATPTAVVETAKQLSDLLLPTTNQLSPLERYVPR